MPRADKSVTFLTGMIIAALYVILLVGFSRESYVLRGNPGAVSASAAAAVCADASKQVCSPDRPTCTPVATVAQEPSCVVPIRMLRRLIAQQRSEPASEIDAAAADSEDE
jgi:hypothetical protein